MTDVSSMSFDHIQVFVKSLQTIDFYKQLELENNEYREKLHNKQIDLTAVNDSNFSPLKQDLVQQLLWGLGCRVIAHNECKSSRSVLVASTPSAQLATRFIITAPTSTEEKNDSEEYPYISGDFANKFFSLHAGHEGFAVFGFLLKEVGACDEIYRICKEKHPALLRFESGPKIFNKNGQEFKVLEIYTFYKAGEDKIADEGTVMRFIEKSGDRSSSLPGFIDDEYSFPAGHQVSYFDHWVSNVMNRKQYLETLKDILGFNPKVDFNAGVVAAGEAIIESTVAGNTSASVPTNKGEFLSDQSQIYLPINNPLSEVGHVAGFIKDLGQGIQHVANRVDDLVEFVTLANKIRRTSGRGFSFLRIPRSYYGRLELSQLVEAGISEDIAQEVFESLIAQNLSTKGGIVKIDVTNEEILSAFNTLSDSSKSVAIEKSDNVVNAIKRSRFSNLYKLLRNVLSDETYLKIVENQILVDIQGKDVLYQIFTANVLQQVLTRIEAEDEAPFLEYIQRVCGLDEVSHFRPGCGGFGIRNFLTLFLSIEVSKALTEYDAAIATKNEKAQKIANEKVTVLSNQLEVSNPILTSISDAMTAEAEFIERYEKEQNESEREKYFKEIERYRKVKEEGQQKLMSVSEDYKQQMLTIRLSAQH